MTVGSPTGTGLTFAAVAGGPCTGTAPTFKCTTPVAAGAPLLAVTVAPAGWTGGLALSVYTGSATTSTTFAIGGTSPNYTINAGPAGIPVGFSGGATVTSTP